MPVASLAVLTACAVIVADGRVGPAERAVFHAINGLPGWLYGPMLVAQYLGVLAMPLVVAAGALAFRRWRLAGALVLLVVPSKLALERVAKLLVEGERPGATVADAILRGVPSAGPSFLFARNETNRGRWRGASQASCDHLPTRRPASTPPQILTSSRGAEGLAPSSEPMTTPSTP
jgi:hypothetical protein